MASSKFHLQRGNGHHEAGERLRDQGRHGAAAVQYAKAASEFDKGAARGRAQQALTRAGTSASRAGLVDDALGYLREAVARARTLSSPLRTAQGLAYLADALRDGRQIKEAAACYRAALATAEEAVAPDDSAESALTVLAAGVGANLGQLLASVGHHGEARECLGDAADRYVALGRPKAALRVLAMSVEPLRAAGEDAMAATLLDTLIAKAGPLQLLDVMALAMDHQGNMARDAGELDGAEALFEGSLRIATVHGDLIGEVRAMTNLGNLAAQRGRRDEARDLYRVAMRGEGRLGRASSMATLQVNLANLEAEAGRLPQALEAYLAAAERFESLGAARTLADVVGLAGQIEARLGRLDAAHAHFEAAMAQALATGHVAAMARLTANLAAIAWSRGDVGAGITGFSEAAQRFRNLGRPTDEFTARLAAADALMVAARYDDARAMLDEAMTALPPGAEREALDLQGLEARLAWCVDPSPVAATRLRAVADRFDEAERALEAWGLRLVALEGVGGVAGAGDAIVAGAARACDWASSQGLRPLWLSASSLLARDDATFSALIAEAESAGQHLLGLRIRRRRAQALGVGVAEALALALKMGALREAAKLRALSR